MNLNSAKRISKRLRDIDMVARLGGDEFVILLENITHEENAAFVAKDLVVELNKPYQLAQSNEAQIGVSIGISLFPQHGNTPETLMNHADTALYKTKKTGRGFFSYFSEEMTLEIQERFSLEMRLRKALDQQQFRVFYQPQIEISSGRIVGAEALVRWQKPNDGLILPCHFIPIAEKSDLIVKIGEWVLRETCRQGRQWLDAGLPPIRLAVNISSRQLKTIDLNALLNAVLNYTGFPSELLGLELTESNLMEHDTKIISILNSLRTLGVQLAIDDFGTGYSSLAYLKHFSVDILKIDRSFISDIPHNQDDMEIASTILAMGHILGFKVSAEGVETAEQLSFLQENGCDLYQGYFKSRPVPAQEFIALIRER